MLNYFVLGYYMTTEALATRELIALLKRQVSWNRLITPVEMDLLVPLPDAVMPLNSDLHFVELLQGDLECGKWTFSVRSRGIKAQRKLSQGMRGFALVQGNIVVGDVWCVFSKDGKPVDHPDLKMLGINCVHHEAYGFDMLIDPSYRGKNLAVPLQRALHRTLQSEGFVRVYGAFYNDNLPALWMHRMLKYKELPKRQVSRFFVFSVARFAVQLSAEVKKKALNRTV